MPPLLFAGVTPLLYAAAAAALLSPLIDVFFTLSIFFSPRRLLRAMMLRCRYHAEMITPRRFSPLAFSLQRAFSAIISLMMSPFFVARFVERIIDVSPLPATPPCC